MPFALAKWGPLNCWRPMSESHSTDDFSEGRFKPHGNIDVRVEGNICIFRAEGPFNMEAIVALGKARRAIVENWDNRGRAATIAVFHNSILMTSDALKAYSDGLKAHLTQVKPNVAVAWVVAPDVEGRALLLPYFAEIFANCNVPWQAFEELDAARAWVKARLDA